jgi:rhodanese-related sulfurtransferase
MQMKEITVQELKKLMDSKADFQLVDVREEHEFDEANLKGLLIPLGDILDRASEVDKDRQVVIHCRSGKRSATAIQALETQLGYTNLYNLKGGILAYIEEIGI